MTTDPDLAAVVRLKNGDIPALEMLVRRHQERAVRTAYAITGDRLLAQDVAADAFVKVIERIDQYDSNRQFAPWFFRIVVNDAVKAARREHRLRLRLGQVAREMEPTHETTDPEQKALAQELQQRVGRAIRALPSKQRAALVLKYYLDYDEATIARIMGSPRGTVKARLHLARARLRKSLNFDMTGG